MALELLRHGYHVTYVALYGSAESVDLGLRFIHPNLELYRADELEVAPLLARLRVSAQVAIVELPALEYLAPAKELRTAGCTIVYDLIDDWSAPSLGGRWYRPETEARFLQLADALVASAPPLAKRLTRRAGRQVVVVPNGVNAAVFGGDPGPTPDDLPKGDGPLFGYHGSLYGDWFDWMALRRVAEQFPAARVVVIGDHRHQHPPMPANVWFLGLKPQSELPAYLSRLDVGIIPWVVSGVTHAVSPLKVYEYLASGVPVAASPLRSLRGLQGVHLA
ncbi:MAG: glycosyltransferase, partial [Acidimicrobiia bacterium]